MKVRYLEKTDSLMGCIKGKVYEVLSIEHGWYRVVDETNDDYLYPPENFEIVDDSDIDQVPIRYMGEEFYEKYKMHGAVRIETEDSSKGYWGEVKKGRPYGLGKAYYPDGTLKMDGIFGIKGLLEGRIYWPNGNIRFEGKFRINRNYGPNIPVEGTLYDEDGKEIYRGEIHVTCGGVGYPTIVEPEGFSTSEYRMPVMPYMWEDENEPEGPTFGPDYNELPSYEEFCERVKADYMESLTGFPEEERLAYFNSDEARNYLEGQYNMHRKSFLAGELTRRQFIGGGVSGTSYCLSLMFE